MEEIKGSLGDRDRQPDDLGTFNFIVSLAFLLLIEALGRSGAFWLYGAIGLLTLLFCWKSSRRPRASGSRTSRRASRRGSTAGPEAPGG